MLTRLRSTVLSLMLVHVVINSCGYLFVKVALREFTPFAFAFWRFLFGLVGVGIILGLRRSWPRIEKADWPRFLLLATLSVPLNQFLYLNGMKYTVPSHASLLYGSTAVVALALSTALGYEKLSRAKVAAILLARAGLILVVSSSRTLILGTENAAGDLLIAISMVVWAAYTVLGKPMVTKYGAVRATLTSLMIGSVIGLPFLIAPALAQDYSVVTWRGWAGTLYTGFMITAVSYTIWFSLLRQIDPSQVAILTTPQPVVTTALSVFILHETLGLSLVVGGLLVIGGVLLMQAPTLLQRKPQEPVLGVGWNNEVKDEA
jgi:drug/metabolite transporter (DMT)-like permease